MVLPISKRKFVFLPKELARLDSILLGLLFSRGLKSKGFKSFDNLIFDLKKKSKGKPFNVFFQVYNKLKPIFLLGNQQMGKRIVYVPIMSTTNRKYVVIMNWIYRQLKGKTNKRGVDIGQLSDLFIETLRNKGIALKQQMEYYKKGIYNRHFMWKPKKVYIKFKPLRKGKRMKKLKKVRRSIKKFR